MTSKVVLVATGVIWHSAAVNAQAIATAEDGLGNTTIAQQTAPTVGGRIGSGGLTQPRAAATTGPTAAGSQTTPPANAAPAVRLQDPSGNGPIKYYKEKGPGRDNVYLDRNEENYTYLRDPARSNDIFDSLKYIPLSRSGDTYVSFNGEVRYRFDDAAHNNLGIARGETTRGALTFVPLSNNRSLLYQRYLLGADIHITNYFNLYLEAIHGQETGHNVASYPGVNRNGLDFGQAFFQVQDNDNPTHLGVRAGRQYIALGSFLQLAPTYSLNIPSPNYDMIRTWADWGIGRVDAFAGNAVNYNFTNTSIFPTASHQDNNKNNIWGVYSSFDLPPFQVAGQTAATSIDGFYFGYRNKTSSLNPSAYYDSVFLTGKNITPSTFSGITTQPIDVRHTVGLRYFGGVGPFDFDYTAAFQGGDYGSYGVTAWSVATDTGYNFKDMLFSPRIGVRINAASGGADKDALHTYQPMQAFVPYYAENTVIAPTNFYNISPRITTRVGSKVVISLYDSFFWRYSTKDTVYSGLWEGGNGANAYAVTAFNRSRFVGQQPAITVDYAPIPHVTIAAQLADFIVGDVLKKGGAKDTYYARVITSFRF